MTDTTPGNASAAARATPGSGRSPAAPSRFLLSSVVPAFALLLLAAGAAGAQDGTFARAWDEVDFLHAGEPTHVANYAEIMGSGACIFDADNDGWEDLLLVNGQYANTTLQAERDPRSQLWRNLQGQGFARVPGALELSAYGMGCATGDYDRDGDQDVAFSTWGSARLYRNDGDLAFTDVTAAAGLQRTHCGDEVCFGESLAWLDYDLDRDLDLYVTNYLDWDGVGWATPLMYVGQCNLLYRNDGDGTFTEVAEAAGAADCGRNHLALAVADYDRDGDPDLFIASDETVDTLLRNRGDGTFEDVADVLGVDDPRGGMGAAWGDYDRDGRQDLVITHFEGETFALYRQQPDGTFQDRARPDGLAATVDYVGWGSEFADLDRDGALDLVLVNGHVNVTYGDRNGYGQRTLVYRGVDGAFVNHTAAAFPGGEAFGVSRGLALGDLDQDGALDMVIVNNPAEPAELWKGGKSRGNWLTLRLQPGPGQPPHSLGAIVEAHAGGAVLEREVVAATSYLSQSSRDLHFGLGDATQVDRLVVRWPGGATQEFLDVAANRLLGLTAGGALEELRLRPLAGAPRTARTDRLAPLTLEGTVLRAPGGATASWTVEGVTTPGTTLQHTFTGTGTVDAVFRVEDVSGHADEAVVEVTVSNARPVPRIAAPATADRVIAVRLDGTASTDPDGRITNWTWEAGGRTLFGPVVAHTFAALGPHAVRLTVRDSDGDTASATATVEVRNVAPTARAGPDVVGNRLSTFTFDGTDSTDPDGAVGAWSWDLGDGATRQGAQVQHGYANPGTYAVRLTVTDADGATATDDLVVTINAENAPPVPVPGPDRAADRVRAVVFDGARSYDPDGRVVAWTWAFGDGATATGAVVEHTYAVLGVFTATLTVTDDTGGTASGTVRVEVRNLPPRLDPGPPRAHEGLGPMAFAATAADDDGTIAAWAWDFGDGATSAEAAPQHAFPAYGHHTVRVAVTDDEGARTEALLPVWVYARPVALPGPDRATDRLTTLAFDGSASHDPDGRVVRWRWDFGDGATAEGPRAEHRFAALGTFPVTLTVTDDDGFEGRATAMVEVRNLLPVPLGTTRALANAHQVVGYADLGSTDPDGAVVQWTWEFGDGATLQGPQVTHGYAATGDYVARLQVTDNDGGTAASAWTVRVVNRLDVAVRLEQEHYQPLDRPRGVVEVRFADGSPVPGAVVDLTWEWQATGPEGSALPPLRVRLQHVEAVADALGRLPFQAPEWAPGLAAPLLAAPTLPGPPGQAPWGHHAVRVLAQWSGNAGDGLGTYTVGLPVAAPDAPGPGGPGSAENVHGGGCGCTALAALTRVGSEGTREGTRRLEA